MVLKAVHQTTQNKISKTHNPVSLWKDPQEKIDLGEMTKPSKTQIKKKKLIQDVKREGRCT